MRPCTSLRRRRRGETCACISLKRKGRREGAVNIVMHTLSFVIAAAFASHASAWYRFPPLPVSSSSHIVAFSLAVTRCRREGRLKQLQQKASLMHSELADCHKQIVESTEERAQVDAQLQALRQRLKRLRLRPLRSFAVTIQRVYRGHLTRVHCAVLRAERRRRRRSAERQKAQRRMPSFLTHVDGDEQGEEGGQGLQPIPPQLQRLGCSSPLVGRRAASVSQEQAEQRRSDADTATGAGVAEAAEAAELEAKVGVVAAAEVVGEVAGSKTTDATTGAVDTTTAEAIDGAAAKGVKVAELEAKATVVAAAEVVSEVPASSTKSAAFGSALLKMKKATRKITGTVVIAAPS